MLLIVELFSVAGTIWLNSSPFRYGFEIVDDL